MAIHEILTFPDAILRTTTKEVQNIDGDTQKLINDMEETMYAAPGAGLAAIQIGIDQSILIYDISKSDQERSLQVLVNPRIVTKEGEFLSEEEGCLSVPDFRSDVKRASRVLVEAVDRHGNPLRLEAEGFPAVVLQHEIDHLNGTLFIDHISSLKRNLYKRRLQKTLKNK